MTKTFTGKLKFHTNNAFYLETSISSSCRSESGKLKSITELSMGKKIARN